MRPNGVEALRGLQRGLLTLVLPEIADPYVQTQVQTMVGLLDTLMQEWDGATNQLVEENGDLVKLLSVAAPVVEDFAQSRARADLVDLARDLTVATQREPESLCISTLQGCNDELQQALTKLLETCEVAATQDPEPSLMHVRREAYCLLARHLRRRPSLHVGLAPGRR